METCLDGVFVLFEEAITCGMRLFLAMNTRATIVSRPAPGPSAAAREKWVVAYASSAMILPFTWRDWSWARPSGI